MPQPPNNTGVQWQVFDWDEQVQAAAPANPYLVQPRRILWEDARPAFPPQPPPPRDLGVQPDVPDLDEELIELEPRGELLVQPHILGFEQTVGEFFGKKSHQRTKDEAVLGIEIENESLAPVDIPSVAGWSFHNEGSLRHFGMEFVLTSPKRKDVAVKMTEDLLEQCKSIKFTNSHRTSVHVHFDATKYKLADVLCFATVYWLLEDILAEYAGDARKDNLFCLRAKNSKFAPANIAESIRIKRPYGAHIFQDGMRYSSLNLAAIAKFGSIESRLMRGTDKLEDISVWIDALDCIRNFALKFDNPYKLRMYLINDVSFEDLPKLIFGEDFLKKLKLPDGYADAMRDTFLWLEPMLIAEKQWDYSKEVAEYLKKAEEERAAVKKAQEAAAIERAQRDRLRVRIVPAAFGLEDNQADQYEALVHDLERRQEWFDE